jgi:hypothetical protein
MSRVVTDLTHWPALIGKFVRNQVLSAHRRLHLKVVDVKVYFAIRLCKMRCVSQPHGTKGQPSLQSYI